MSEQLPSKKPRTRSPAYPAIGLEESIQRSASLWGKINRHWGAASTVIELWGFDKESSSGFSILSALIKFGLLEDKGSGKDREVKLTESAIGLVYNPLPDSEEHKAALRKAALLPVIHADLWKKFTGELPHDSVIERYLVMERGFNSDYVKGFIKQFRSTIVFAGLKAGDTVEGDQINSDQMTPAAAPVESPKKDLPPVVPATVSNSVAPVQPAMPDRVAAAPRSHREVVLPHPKGDITISGPFPLSQADWAVFTALINAFQPWLVKEQASPTASQPLSSQSPSAVQE